MHISEFNALAIVQIEIMLARGERGAAKSWLEMWEQINRFYFTVQSGAHSSIGSLPPGQDFFFKEAL